MMKKLILLTIAGAVTFGANAQDSNPASVVFKSYNAEKNIAAPLSGSYAISSGTNTSNSANKGTATGGSRWYSVYGLADVGYTGGGQLSTGRFVGMLGWDSTQRQRFVDAQTQQPYYGGVNWISIASFVDPIFSVGFNHASYYSSEDPIKITQANTYKVDSIRVQAAYMEGTSGDPATIDTLYLSVAPVLYSDQEYDKNSPTTRSPSPFLKVEDYEGVKANGGKLKVQDLGPTDSLNRQLGHADAKKWKVTLPPTERQPKTSTGQYPTAVWSFDVPDGGLTVPAGRGFAMSLAFKSGETFPATAPYDSVADHHYWMFIYAQAADNARMPYYYYDYKDHSMSYLMHYEGQDRYVSSVLLEIVNSTDFDKEFILMEGFATCNDCWTLGLNKVNSTLNKFDAYPNPAISDLTVSYTLNKTADVNINVTNAIGQTMKTQNIANTASGKAQFSVADLPNGLYFYTVSADGESVTRRFVVAH